MIRNSLFIILLYFLLLWPLVAEGAVLYLEPSKGTYQPGDVFGVEMKIDTGGECINVIEANLKFSQDILKAIDFSRGQSIITLWVKEPGINQETGVISWSGGIPNGYCGRILGDPGASNLLGRIIFRIPEIMVGEPGGNLAMIEILDTSQVFLNDGLGTKAKTIVHGANFEILKKPEPSKDEWQEEIKKDNILPEPFKVEISRDPLIFEGRYFITFSTTDKQTGIDYYEVKEGKKDWKIAVSPYVLENQKLFDDIWIKAVDKAGNEWIEIIKASRKPIWQYILYGVLVLIGLLVIIIIGNKIKKL